MKTPVERYRAEAGERSAAQDPNHEPPLAIRILEEQHEFLVSLAVWAEHQTISHTTEAARKFLGRLEMGPSVTAYSRRADRIVELERRLAASEASCDEAIKSATGWQQKANNLEETLRNATEKIGQALLSVRCLRMNDGLVDWVLRYIRESNEVDKRLRAQESLALLRERAEIAEQAPDRWKAKYDKVRNKLGQIHADSNPEA